MQIELFDGDGNRKYVSPGERKRFMESAMQVPRSKRMFSLMLYHTGCRNSEALELKVGSIDFPSGCAVIRTLKRRSERNVYRQVPLPDSYLRSLDDAYDLRTLQKKNGQARNGFIWGWSRKYGYDVVKEVMGRAGIHGVQAAPKGLRHGFAIACLDRGIPLNMVQKWLGHANIETTAIYANALGQEERKLAARLWADDPAPALL